MTHLKEHKKRYLIILLIIIIVISLVIGLTNKKEKKEVKKLKEGQEVVVNDEELFNLEDTRQESFRKLRFNIPNEFKKNLVNSKVVKYKISTKKEKATLIITAQVTKKTPKEFLMDEFGFKKSDGFRNKKINKAVWLKVKKKNIYGYAIRQRGYIFAIRYSYSKSEKVAKVVPKILEDTLYFKVYYGDKKTK